MRNVERLIENYERSPESMNPARKRIAQMHKGIHEMHTSCKHCQNLLEQSIDVIPTQAVILALDRYEEASPTSERRGLVYAAD